MSLTHGITLPVSSGWNESHVCNVYKASVSEIMYLNIFHFDSNNAIHKAAGLTVPGRSMICLVLFHYSTVPTVKPSMLEWPLGVIPATSIFGNGR